MNSANRAESGHDAGCPRYVSLVRLWMKWRERPAVGDNSVLEVDRAHRLIVLGIQDELLPHRDLTNLRGIGAPSSPALEVWLSAPHLYQFTFEINEETV